MFPSFCLNDLPGSPLPLSQSALHWSNCTHISFSLKPNRKNSKSLWNCSKFRLQRAKSSLTLLLRRLLPPTDSEKCHCHLLRFREWLLSQLALHWNFISDHFVRCHVGCYTVILWHMNFFFFKFLPLEARKKRIHISIICQGSPFEQKKYTKTLLIAAAWGCIIYLFMPSVL